MVNYFDLQFTANCQAIGERFFIGVNFKKKFQKNTEVFLRSSFSLSEVRKVDQSMASRRGEKRKQADPEPLIVVQIIKRRRGNDHLVTGYNNRSIVIDHQFCACRSSRDGERGGLLGRSRNDSGRSGADSAPIPRHEVKPGEISQDDLGFKGVRRRIPQRDLELWKEHTKKYSRVMDSMEKVSPFKIQFCFTVF